MFEIAYAAATQRLCLFTGTGFSKAISDQEAPGWQSLLEEVCDGLPEGADLKAALFPQEGDKPLSLEEAAQVIELKLSRHRRSINTEIKAIIESLSVKGEVDSVLSFFQQYAFRVVTTNYDKLSEELGGSDRVQSIAPGRPIPRASAPIKVYHVHGSIDSPENMVVTSDDYFRFMNSDSYFSRKLSTILHENTVVIIGYSLGDTNLKRIINDYKSFANDHVIGSNLFFVSRKKIDQIVKDFYFHSFGIRVVDDLEVGDFFARLNRSVPIVSKIVEKSLKSISNVIENGMRFKDTYIKLEDSFFRVIASLPAKGLSLKDPRVVEVIGDFLDRKRDFTLEPGAWEQYDHLASWLIHLGTVFDVANSTIKEIYLKAVRRSMITMSKEKRLGYSWQAYKLWLRGWASISAANRTMIREYINDQAIGAEAQLIVNSVD
ncbi:SIR2 family protein [Pseudomonas aeruginosa]|uniref:SIR2 family protein n=1 Tax=Pseudomonas aeruginosa TaxID=287 RepID=UPI0004F30F9A|nr:SIR2 family protein [Pseudomonas aeruginosa]ELK3486150.1 SIR2 family protein [Pseudomonas aeruginosa]ELK3488824.1 SIR2 family protein [Pseudomonas aeruginosa]EME9750205.1 SIR2 family protein [Pseudomonas aeruginosa]MBH9070812.1 SIR2 family protein [Pseudomonas aeruginosa]MCT0329562.1 SIR2 family protein [Pseudomonas aeruginosa]